MAFRMKQRARSVIKRMELQITCSPPASSVDRFGSGSCASQVCSSWHRPLMSHLEIGGTGHAWSYPGTAAEASIPSSFWFRGVCGRSSIALPFNRSLCRPFGW